MPKCIIIDDEPHAMETLKGYVKLLPELEVVAVFHDPLEAMRFFAESEKLDLVLLDVDMPKISGIELAKQVRAKTDKLVFVTAHTKYAFEAFGVDANAYLLKPISLAIFISTIQKLFSLSGIGEQSASDSIENDFFFVKSREDSLKLIKIRYGEIVAIESNLNYINIHTEKKSILTYMSLTEISKRLANRTNFLQFQRSFILNQNFIDNIEGNSIKMTTGQKITVGEYYKKEFNKFVTQYLVKVKRRG